LGSLEPHRKFYAAAVERLCRYGESIWRDGRRLSDGATAGDHFASAARQLAADGKTDIAVQILAKHPPFPFAVEYLWNWFGELMFGVKATGMGPAMASWGDILEWEAAAGLVLQPWERVALARLSHARAMVESERSMEAVKNASRQTRSNRS
jgi:hypothetical protein